MVEDILPLYRYIPFHRFIQMLFFKEIAVVTPSLWNDGYELYFLKLLGTPEGEIMLRNYLSRYNGSQEKNSQSVQQLSDLLSRRTYCLCFSESKDSEVLWRANSDDRKGIMFATTAGRIEALFSSDDMAVIKRVNYDLEEMDMTSDYLQLFDAYDGGVGCSDIDEPFLHKRACFSYEKECRLLVRPELINEDKVRKYAIPNLSTFITGVMAHPLADKDHVELVKKICETYDINFEGQSEVYQFKPIH